VYVPGGAALSVVDAQGAALGRFFELGTIEVTSARRPPAALDSAQALAAPLGPLTLLGFTLESPAPQAGDDIGLTLFWRAEGAARPDAAVRLELAAGGQVLQTLGEAPAAGHPTSAWAAGEVVRTPLRLRVPAAAPAGPAELRLSVVPAGAAAGAPLAGPLVLAVLDVRVPERSFDPPAMQQAVGAELGGQARLLGLDVEDGGGVTLYWQALAPMETSYTAFVHALAADGTLLAQSDARPAGGARSTTGWLPGEVVADRHSLPLAGAARLAIGLYDAETLARLGVVEVAVR
jgi:hypothetical protein